jgi:hypothetical protein
VFDQFQGFGGHEPRWIGVKILIGGAALALLSLGLCGVGAVMHSTQDDILSFFGFFGSIGSGLLMAFAVVVTLIEIVVVWIRNRVDNGDTK